MIGRACLGSAFVKLGMRVVANESSNIEGASRYALIDQNSERCSIIGEYKSDENVPGRWYPEVAASAMDVEDVKPPDSPDDSSDDEDLWGPEEVANLLYLGHLQMQVQSRLICSKCRNTNAIRSMCFLASDEGYFVGHHCVQRSDNDFAVRALRAKKEGVETYVSGTVLKRGLDVIGLKYAELEPCDPEIVSQLNGANGEATNKDDVKKSNRSSVSKAVARTLAKTALNRATGNGDATYKLIANIVKSVNKTVKTSGKKGSSTKKIPGPGGGRDINSSLSGYNRLSAEATRYLMAYVRPFDSRVIGAYVPKPPDQRTQKVAAFARFYIGAPTTGGFVMCCPCVASDMPTAWYTSSSFVGSATAFPTAANANFVYGVNFSNLPYTRAQIISTSPGSIIESRIVSYTVKVTYHGTVLNRGGTMFIYSDIEADSVIGYNSTTIGAKATAIIRPIDGSPIEFTILPGRSISDEFEPSNAGVTTTTYPYCQGVSGTDPTSSSSTTVGVPQFVIYFNPAATGNYMVEIVQHVEFIGTGVSQSAMTFCKSDRVGYEMVQSVLTRAQDVMTSRKVDLPRAVNQVLRERRITVPRGWTKPEM